MGNPKKNIHFSNKFEVKEKKRRKEKKRKEKKRKEKKRKEKKRKEKKRKEKKRKEKKKIKNKIKENLVEGSIARKPKITMELCCYSGRLYFLWYCLLWKNLVFLP